MSETKSNSVRVKEELCQNEELQSLIFRNLRDYAIFIIDLDGRISSWNPGVEDVLGYKEQEFIGQPLTTIFTPEDLEEGAAAYEWEKAIKTGRAEDDRWHLRKDDRRIWVNGILCALHDTDGRLRGFVKIMRDYTDKKRQEEKLERRIKERTQELRLAESRFEQIFRLGPFAAVITTMGIEHRFLEANESFERLTGYRLEEVRDKTNLELGMWASAEQARSVHRALERDGHVSEVELTVTTKDGQKRTVLTSAAVVPREGDELVVWMFYDITERKRSQEELSQAIQEALQDATWFSHAVVEKLANLHSAGQDPIEVAELTNRERQVLERVGSGMNNDEIGRDLGISPQTVRNYISTIYSKINVKSRAEAVVWARERGLLGR